MNSIKFRLAVFVIIFCASKTLAQDNSVGINTLTPDANAVLHLVSPNGNQGLLIPQLTTDQRNAMAPTDASNGLIVFDNDEQQFYFWSGTGWRAGLGIFGSAVVSGGDIVGTFPTLDIADGVITNQMITDGTIDQAKLAAIPGLTAGSFGAVNQALTITVNASGQITAITSAPIAIDGTNIADGSIVESKIADGAVTNAKIGDDAVNSAKIQDGQVTTDDILDGTVVNADLGVDAVTSDRILDGEVMTADIADAAVDNAKIADASINNAKVEANTLQPNRLLGPLQTSNAGLMVAQGTTVNIGGFDFYVPIWLQGTSDKVVTTDNFGNYQLTDRSEFSASTLATGEIFIGGGTGSTAQRFAVDDGELVIGASSALVTDEFISAAPQGAVTFIPSISGPNTFITTAYDANSINNGLTLLARNPVDETDGGTIQLGGDLVQSTTITQVGFDFSMDNSGGGDFTLTNGLRSFIFRNSGNVEVSATVIQLNAAGASNFSTTTGVLTFDGN